MHCRTRDQHLEESLHLVRPADRNNVFPAVRTLGSMNDAEQLIGLRESLRYLWMTVGSNRPSCYYKGSEMDSYFLSNIISSPDNPTLTMSTLNRVDLRFHHGTW
jgi:hypothetical protein